jgi:putative acetyltransferase
MFTIRSEEKADHARVFEILTAAFERNNEANLVEVLRSSAEPQISLVAEDDGRILGHIFFSPVEIEASGEPPGLAGLAPVSVDPAHQGLGIGGALIRAGLERCRELSWQAVFLVGNPAYYSQFGFALASPMGFSYGDPAFDAVLQAHEVSPRTLDGHGGRVRFHPAFAATGCG